MSDKKSPITIYLTPDQRKNLRILSEETSVPQAVLIRQAIDEILKRNDPQQELRFPGVDHESE